MVTKVQTYIEQHHLLQKSRLYLVALSGGADSVSLLRLLLALGYRIEAVHCNFHLRGEESERDELFVNDLCKRLTVPLHIAHFDTTAYAELHKISIEMAARRLRYHYFNQLRKDLDADAVCVAHHRDDNVETLLINMLRGTGIHGMAGIRPRRDDSGGTSSEACVVVRPLLCVSRKEIIDYLKDIQQDYVTDSTNLEDEVVRNKIRLNVIPLLQQINPAAVENLHRTIELMTEAESVYNAYIQANIERLVHEQSMSVTDLQQTASPLSILYEWLGKYGFSAATIRQIDEQKNAPSGRIWRSSTHEICIDRDRIILTPVQNELPTMHIPESGLYAYSNDLRIRVSIMEEPTLSRSPLCACLDSDKVRFPLVVRPLRTGDRFVPFGMTGSRLLSDFLTDLKVPVVEKRRQLVVTDAQDHILWVVGRRPANPYCITTDTKQMLKLSIEHIH